MTNRLTAETIGNLKPAIQAQIRAQLGGGKPIGVARGEAVSNVLVEVAPELKRIRQSAKPLENKLEREFREYLERQYPHVKIYAQAKRYRLANGLWYKPDCVFFLDGRETVYECKGPHAFRGGFENLKMAATTYQDSDWWLAWKVDGEWQLQRVLA